MPMSQMLDLALAFHESLSQNLPALVMEINNTVQPSYPISLPPDGVELGVAPDLIDTAIESLPNVQCGIYSRLVVDEGEQDFAEYSFPYVVNIYLSALNKHDLFILSMKWAYVMDAFVERYAQTVHPSFNCDEAPDIDITYALPARNKKSVAALVSTIGVYTSFE